jgi:NTE family protein
MSTQAAGEKVVNLALQGGGSHGAFTWGVLDRLLEEKRLSFEGITATSAGAVNAVVLADGLAAAGREGAKNALRRYWQKVSELASSSIFRPSLFDKANPGFGLEHSPDYLFIESLTYFASPYQMNPFNYNPLKDLLSEAIDFERVRQQQPAKLFICATNVETAKVKVFTGKDVGVKQVLASACLPLMMQAVEIDGEHYWDGSFTGNPAIFPLVLSCEAPDPNGSHHASRSSGGSDHFSIDYESDAGDQLREMRTIAYLTTFIDAGKLDGGKRMFVHLIEAEDLIRELSWSSRLNGDWEFLTRLFGMGRQRAGNWLQANYDSIGNHSTIDLREKYF